MTVAQNHMLQFGDVLMTEGGDIDKLGRGTIWRSMVKNCLHQNHVFAVRCQKPLVPEYLEMWLAASRSRYYFHSSAKKTTNLASTNSRIVRELPISLPTIVEQQRLVDEAGSLVAPLAKLAERTGHEIALLQEFRTRLVADVVTGQVDVRAIAGTLPDSPESVIDLSADSDGELTEIAEGNDE